MLGALPAGCQGHGRQQLGAWPSISPQTELGEGYNSNSRMKVAPGQYRLLRQAKSQESVVAHLRQWREHPGLMAGHSPLGNQATSDVVGKVYLDWAVPLAVCHQLGTHG